MNEKYFENEEFKSLKFIGDTFFDYHFVDCRFEDCRFEECMIDSCEFLHCTFFHSSIISLKTKNSEVKNASFHTCNLIGVHWAEVLSPTSIAQPIYQLRDSFLKYNTFSEMNFRKFDFSNNHLQDCSFDECNLMESSFCNCNLEASIILSSDIRKADFRGARGYSIDLTSNKLKDARFSFPEVINLLNGLDIRID